jgi:hypothetical protein
MASYRITGIHKPDRNNPHDRIKQVEYGGRLHPEKDVIGRIKSGADTFYVSDPQKGKRSDVGVVDPGKGRKPFLRTLPDKDKGDNLLSLPER